MIISQTQLDLTTHTQAMEDGAVEQCATGVNRFLHSSQWWRKTCVVWSPPLRQDLLLQQTSYDDYHTRDTTTNSLFLVSSQTVKRNTGDLPKRFDGFLLKSIRKRLCASKLKNCGIPSFALMYRNRKRKIRKAILPAFYVHGGHHDHYTNELWRVPYWFFSLPVKYIFLSSSLEKRFDQLSIT